MADYHNFLKKILPLEKDGIQYVEEKDEIIGYCNAFMKKVARIISSKEKENQTEKYLENSLTLFYKLLVKEYLNNGNDIDIDNIMLYSIHNLTEESVEIFIESNNIEVNDDDIDILLNDYVNILIKKYESQAPIV